MTDPTSPGLDPLVLVVDDEPELCRALDKLLTRNGFRVVTAGNGEEALMRLREHEVHLVLTDLIMPKMGGLDLLKAGKVLSPHTEFVVISGHGTIETAVDAMKHGAYDFVEKPFSTAITLKTVRQALERQRLQAENIELRRQLEEIQGQSNIIGRSDVMRQAMDTAQQVAASTATVLLTGESGTGKEVFADAIHRWSERRQKSLVKVSCAALPETLLEAELFGYEAGAFTGAVGHRTGRYEMADGGTLFLDEVGEMSLTTQVKLLRVLQEGTFERLGSSDQRSADVRLLAATNADLARKVEDGTFREDLFYRLNVINVELPALRTRGEDVILLANFFLQIYAQKNGKELSGFTRQAVEALSRHSWPGNVRELENCIERCVVLSKGPFVDADVLPNTVLAGNTRYEQVVIPVGTPLRQAEMKLIDATLRSTGGDKDTAARILGITARTIYRKLQ